MIWFNFLTTALWIYSICLSVFFL